MIVTHSSEHKIIKTNQRGKEKLLIVTAITIDSKRTLAPKTCRFIESTGVEAIGCCCCWAMEDGLAAVKRLMLAQQEPHLAFFFFPSSSISLLLPPNPAFGCKCTGRVTRQKKSSTRVTGRPRVKKSERPNPSSRHHIK